MCAISVDQSIGRSSNQAEGSFKPSGGALGLPYSIGHGVLTDKSIQRENIQHLRKKTDNRNAASNNITIISSKALQPPLFCLFLLFFFA